MNATAQKETLGFQTEAKQLLHLMIHSLYSNKEIFLRELISNASDAIDRLRFEALSNENLLEAAPDSEVRVEVDKEAGTITICDNGIGMNREEVIENLGTIAKSGTAAFLKSLTGDQQQDAQLIGQFGVGFYSAFIVADRVEVLTRRAGDTIEQGVHWESQGEAEFSVENCAKADRGATIILHLKKDCIEFADDWRVRSIIKKYSDHISVPVMMEKPAESSAGEESEKGEKKEADEPAPQFEAINEATALWTRSRSEVSDDEYKAFYQHVSHDFEDPLIWSHNRVEGKLEYIGLLYIPARAPFDLWHRESPRGLKLYVQRVFIMDDAEQFLPLYLRFVRGVVDSNDLSLNVSREILQQDPQVSAMRAALTKRVLDMIEKLAADAEKYQPFWDEFGQVLKEGPAEDFGNKEKIARLLRFSSTHTSTATQDQSLAAYVERMKPEQSKIYYVAADNYHTAANSPHLEVFKKKGIEVLLLHDRIDEWLVGHLQEFDGKQFQGVARGELDLGDLEDKEEKGRQEEADKEFSGLTDRIKAVLSDSVEEVRLTHRLTDSPACLVVSDDDMGMQMRRVLESAGQAVPEGKRIFEINSEHPLVRRLNDEQDEDHFNNLTLVLFDQSKLAEGTQLEEPASYVDRLNKLLLELAG